MVIHAYSGLEDYMRPCLKDKGQKTKTNFPLVVQITHRHTHSSTECLGTVSL